MLRFQVSSLSTFLCPRLPPTKSLLLSPWLVSMSSYYQSKAINGVFIKQHKISITWAISFRKIRYYNFNMRDVISLHSLASCFNILHLLDTNMAYFFSYYELLQGFWYFSQSLWDDNFEKLSHTLFIIHLFFTRKVFTLFSKIDIFQAKKRIVWKSPERQLTEQILSHHTAQEQSWLSDN